MDDWITALVAWLALPEQGLSTLFVISLLSATLLPVGFDAALFGLLTINPGLFWPALLVATAGNTLGGAISYGMGYGAERVVEKITHKPREARALAWLKRFGPKACLMAWLPVVGDPLCAVAGWLKLPFWPCVGYMLVGKFLRYLVMTTVLLWVFPG